jgi:hypothetical protein
MQYETVINKGYHVFFCLVQENASYSSMYSTDMLCKSRMLYICISLYIPGQCSQLMHLPQTAPVS